MLRLFKAAGLRKDAQGRRIVPSKKSEIALPIETLAADDAGQALARACSSTENLSSITVKVPLTNVLTPDSLREIATRVSLGEDIVYGE